MLGDNKETAMNPNFKELLQFFNANNVEYLIVRGHDERHFQEVKL